MTELDLGYHGLPLVNLKQGYNLETQIYDKSQVLNVKSKDLHLSEIPAGAITFGRDACEKALENKLILLYGVKIGLSQMLVQEIYELPAEYMAFFELRQQHGREYIGEVVQDISSLLK